MTRHPSGALRVRGQVARVGVLDYPERGERHLVLPEELFAPATVASLRDAPVTIEHPAGGEVTLDSWADLSVGHVCADAGPSGSWLAGPLAVTRADAVARVENRSLVELSGGYSCDLEDAPGEYLGQPYTHVKRGILYNHVALGPENWARAGRGARLYLDGRIVMARIKPIQITDGGKLLFDGREFALRDEAQRAAGVEAARSHLRSVQVADAADPAALRSLLDEAMGTLMGLTDQLAAIGAALADEPAMPDTVEAAVAALPAAVLDGIGARYAPRYLEVRDQARRIAPEMQCDGMSLAEIRRKAVVAAGHRIPDDASDDYVAGVFGAMPAAGTFSRRDLDAIEGGGGSDGDDPVAKARADRRSADKDRWRRKSA